MLVSVLLADCRTANVNMGFVGPVNEISAHPDGERIVTIGNDGTLRVLEERTGSTLHRLQISALPLVRLAVHPERPYAATVESDEVSIFWISVWDWEENRRLFRRRIEEKPLAFSFSPRGTHLIYTTTNWRSVFVLDSETGQLQTRLSNGFGIVSAFVLGSTEQTFLAYLPSGSIQYRETATGELRGGNEFPTISNLDNVHFIQKNRYAIGTKNNNLIAIDLLTGAEVARRPIGRLVSLSIDESNDEILVATNSENDGPELSLYSLGSSGFLSRYLRFDLPEDPLSAMDISERTLYTGTGTGKIVRQTRYQSSPETLLEPRLAQVNDLGPGRSILLTTPERIVTVYSSTLASGNLSSTFAAETELLTYSRPNPLGSPLGVNVLTDNYYILWSKNGTSSGAAELPRVLHFSSVEGAMQDFSVEADSPIAAFETRGFNALTLDTRGNVDIRNLFDDEPSFELTSFELRDVAFADINQIVVAGRLSTILQTTTYRIDTRTGETVGLDVRGSVTFDIHYDPDTKRLYAMTIAGERDTPKTIVTEHYGDGFEHNREVYSIDGEHFDAAFTSLDGDLFFSLAGRVYARRSNSSRLDVLESNNNVPRALRSYADWLFSINRDSSVSLWKASTGTYIATFYLFELDPPDATASSPEWAVIHASGRYLTSPDLDPDMISAR